MGKRYGNDDNTSFKALPGTRRTVSLNNRAMKINLIGNPLRNDLFIRMVIPLADTIEAFYGPFPWLLSHFSIPPHDKEKDYHYRVHKSQVEGFCLATFYKHLYCIS